jgi:hypothetical protein
VEFLVSSWVHQTQKCVFSFSFKIQPSGYKNTRASKFKWTGKNAAGKKRGKNRDHYLNDMTELG